MRAEAEGKDPHEAVAAANGEDAAEDEGADEGADEGDVPVDAEPVADATAEPVPTEPQGVPNFDDEPQVAIDTEGAVAENHEASAAVFGGAATVPAGPAHEGGLPLVDGAGEDPGCHGGHAGYAPGVGLRVYHHHVPAPLPYADERSGK